MFVLLDVTVQAQLEEINPESESDGPDCKVGKVLTVIIQLWHAAALFLAAEAVQTLQTVQAGQVTHTQQDTHPEAAFRQQMDRELPHNKSTEFVQIL